MFAVASVVFGRPLWISNVADTDGTSHLRMCCEGDVKWLRTRWGWPVSTS
jgi:hypothetical protein